MADPIRILSLDGGGLSTQSQLLILKDFMETVDPISLPKPCEYFDMIGGAIGGGIIAVMLGRLRMSVDDCITAYSSLADMAVVSMPSSSVFLTPSQRKVNSSALRKTIKEMLEKNGCSEDTLFLDKSDNSCRTFVTASIIAATDDSAPNSISFTSYSIKDLEASAKFDSVKIWEVCFAAFFQSRLFDNIQVGFFENTSPCPNYHSNPIMTAWEQARIVWNEKKISNDGLFVSLGTGYPGRSNGQGYTEVLASGPQNGEVESRFMISRTPEFQDRIKNIYFRFNTPDVDVWDLKEDTIEERVKTATVKYLNSWEVARTMKACVHGVQFPSLWNTEIGLSRDTAESLSLHYEPDKNMPDFQGSSWLDGPNPDSHVSFGDSGVTGTVNCFGELLQFTTYLDAGTSSLFCADHTSISEPYCVRDRMQDWAHLTGERGGLRLTYGLRVAELADRPCSDVSYVHDRWPRFDFTGETINATVQWIINDGTVVQSCLFKNKTKSTQTQTVHFGNGFHIRDLEYVDSKNSFNDLWLGHGQCKGPNDYGWILVNPLGPKMEMKKPKQQEHAMYDAEETDSIEESTVSSSSRKVVNEAANTPGMNADDKDMRKGNTSHHKETNRTSEDIKHNPWAVAVLVSIFINGKQQKWGDIPHPLSDDDVEFEVTFEGNSTTEVAVAYKTILLPQDLICGPKGSWSDFLISPSAVNVAQFLSREAAEFEPFYASAMLRKMEDPASQFSISGFPPSAAASSNHIDFIIRRNIEHILSVCSIPICTSTSKADGTFPIALTCGDMSGHRVHTSASFFAFHFLLEISGLIAKAGANKYKSLQRRIKHVCIGHVHWLSRLERREPEQVAANYWPTGRLIILPASSKSFLPPHTWTDAALQLLKVTEFAKTCPSEEDQELTKGVIVDIADEWTEELRVAGVLGSGTWAHSKAEGYQKYRLSEQIWIWKAMKEIQPYLSEDTPTGQINSGIFHDFRNLIHRRFITEDNTSNKLMLATTRSLGETRFLLHASDTVLFYALEWDFFLKLPSVQEVWENTLASQVRYRENSEATWEKLTRYSLATMLGARNLTLNKRPPASLLDSSLDVLMRTTSPNGLFYRRVDRITKKPKIFLGEPERDVHFHATFEIPYILLKDLGKICVIPTAASKKPSESMLQAKLSNYGLITKNVQDQQTFPIESDNSKTEIAQAGPEHADDQNFSLEATLSTNKQPDTLLVKKRASNNMLVGQNNIVELEDEWLYNYPSFFQTTSPGARVYSKRILEIGIKRLLEQTEGDTAGSEIIKAAHALLASDAVGRGMLGRLYNESISTWVTDVPKQNTGKKFWHLRSGQNYSVLSRDFQNSGALFQTLSGWRSMYNAKKRFIWLAEATSNTALICVTSSAEDEKQPMMQFFDRHAQYHDAFLDRVNMALNVWETELHLSFYRLVDQDYKPGLDSCIPLPNASVLPRGAKLRLAQASMGFRFIGDVFDRYWTCHFVEYLPDCTNHLEIHPWDQGNDVVQKQGCWRQRKVLELHLFDRMLKELVSNSNHIFREIQMELGIKHGAFAFSITNSDVYFSSSTRWQEFQQILQVVEEELSGVLAVIAKWETRERDRGAHQPRWTRNDERKYRNSINRLERMNRGRIGELQKCHGSIRSLRETLVRRQEQIRDDLGLRGAENIRFFTYVTVVFLPLGFAASIFSMNGTPPANLIRDMAIFAIIALLITAIALINAKRVNAIMAWLKGLLEAQSIQKINESPLFDSYETRKSKREDRARRANNFELSYRWEREVKRNGLGNNRGNIGDANSEAVEDTPLFKYRHAKVPFHLGFWLGYLFLEFPARRVLMGFDALTKPDFTESKTYVSVILGIILLPIFFLSYAFQTIFYNTLDLTKLCWKHAKQTRQKAESTPLDEALFRDRLNWLMFPHRPLLQPGNQESEATIEKGKG